MSKSNHNFSNFMNICTSREKCFNDRKSCISPSSFLSCICAKSRKTNDKENLFPCSQQWKSCSLQSCTDDIRIFYNTRKFFYGFCSEECYQKWYISKCPEIFKNTIKSTLCFSCKKVMHNRWRLPIDPLNIYLKETPWEMRDNDYLHFCSSGCHDIWLKDESKRLMKIVPHESMCFTYPERNSTQENSKVSLKTNNYIVCQQETENNRFKYLNRAKPFSWI